MLVKLAAPLAAALASGLATIAAGAARVEGTSAWSWPVALSRCGSGAAPHVVFPSDRPDHSTGAGAIVWAQRGDCAGGEGLYIAPIGALDQPQAARRARSASRSAVELDEPLLASGGPHGQIVIGGGTRPGDGAGAALVQGPAAGPFAAAGTVPAAARASALTSAYLGDVALAASPARSDAHASLRLLVERYFAHAFGLRGVVSPPLPGSVRELTPALDYRTDALLAWWQSGALYGAELPQTGPPQSPQRLASAPAVPSIAALMSDDTRGIVAWSEYDRATTSVYVDISAPGARFGPPTLLERFSDARGGAAPPAVRLVRLSSESVMMAWTGAAAGRWVVRVAAVDLDGVHAISTISGPGSDALLADLVPGPDDEAVALWSEPRRSPVGELELSEQAIYAARGINLYRGRTSFGQPELIAPQGPNDQPTLAIDPNSDRAIAAWRGAGDAIEYAIRRQTAG